MRKNEYHLLAVTSSANVYRILEKYQLDISRVTPATITEQ